MYYVLIIYYIVTLVAFSHQIHDVVIYNSFQFTHCADCVHLILSRSNLLTDAYSVVGLFL